MLYHVRMDVSVPHDVDPDRFEELKAEEKARAQDLQRQSKWCHLWRIAVDYPGSPVPPCVHRAPETRPGRPPRLLLIS